MIFFGWTFPLLMTFADVASNVQLNNESHVSFLLENGKNNTKKNFWGLFDTTATVGVVFHYNISAVFPYGEDVKYVVSEVDSDDYKLPTWLQFDKVTSCLIGVPHARDAPKIFYLKVSLVDNHNSRFDVGDVFSIKVNEQTPYYVGTSARPLERHDNTSMLVKCLPGSTVTTTTVVIDADFNVLLPSNMVGIIQNLCKYLGLSLTATRLVSPATIPYLDNTALVAGPGDVKVPIHTGAWLQWEVGCGNVYSYHMGILQKLEVASQNGDISKSIGYGIVGWYVTNIKALHTNLYRLKRQAPIMLTTPTVVQTMGPPAAKAVPTVTVSESKSINDPPTRVVLSQISPVYPTTEATDLHKAHIKSAGIKSKTAKPKLSKTSFRAPPGITPVQVIPTDVSYEPNEKFVNTKSSSIIDSDLEPSVIMPQATNNVPTAILETRMYIVTDFSLVTQPSKVVQASSISSLSTSGVPTEVFIGNPSFQTSRQLLDDSGPRVNAELGTLSSTVRKVFMYKIPDHLFSDSIDGNTDNLKLQFSMPDGYDTSIVPWVKFNEATHVLFGFPLSISNQQYFLSATNSRGKSSRIGFYINVQEQSKYQRVNFEMSITLEADFKKFINNVSVLVDIATKISSAFGDEEPSQLLITSIKMGSVEYNWTNSSLSAEHCHIDQILTLAEYFIMPNCSLNSHFLETLKPFIIKKATIIPKSSCDFETREAVIPLPASSLVTNYQNVQEVETENAETDVIVSIIVPVVISVAIVILAIIIVCVLYRKCHKAGLSDRTKRKSVKKGTPVIFTTELEDKLIASNKPLIMKNEKPPQPPDYQQPAVGSNFPSMPHSKYYEPLISDNQNCLISEMPTQSSTIQSQRCMGLQTSYRNPPPYDAP